MTLPTLAHSARRGDQVFDALRTAILSGALEPGTRLRIRDIAEQLGTSVMPVRDAMPRLEEAGLVESAPYRGAVVRAFSPDEMLQIYEVRRVLEAEAARRGAVRADAQVTARMRSQRDEARAAIAAGDQPAFIDHDEALLRTLYAAVGNPVLTDAIDRLWRRSRSFKLFGVRGEWGEGPTVLLEYQDELLAAVAAGDAERAGRAVEGTIDRACDVIRAALPDGTQGL